MNMCCTHSK